VGKRYTEEEKRLIQELVALGYTDKAIAQQLDRSTNAIRNIRYRTHIKTQETQTIKNLQQEKQVIEQQIKHLDHELRQLKTRREQTYNALQVEQKQFIKKLETELTKLKNTKPELFTITIQEEIGKLTAQLAVSFVKWLIE